MTTHKDELTVNANNRSLVALTLASLLTACTTTTEPAPKPRPQPSVEKPVAEKPKPVETAPKFSVRQVIEMTNRLSKPENPVTPQDEKIIAMVKPGPEPASVEEAVLALVVLRANVARGEAPHVVEEDMLKGEGAHSGEASPAAAPKPSLEEQMREKGVQFPQALANNPLLRNIDVFKLTARVLQNTQDEAGYRKEIVDIVKTETAALTILNEGETQPAEKAAAPTEVAPAAKKYGAGEFVRGDVLLTESQRLADRGDFKPALAKAQQINNEDPFYGSAQDQIKRISNRAVQDLRQKAAQAYQSSMPLTQNDAKASYLEKARDYLNQALQEYPASDQLGTVRDNLSVITKNLDALKRGEAAGPSEGPN